MIKYKGFNLPGDLPLLAAVFFLLLYYTVLLKIFSYRKVLTIARGRKAIDSKNRLPSLAEQAELEKMYRSAGYFLKTFWRSDRPCLRRTLILHRWCSRRGIPSKVVIGVSRENGELLSHAWLEIGGRPFRETPEQLDRYKPILED